MPVQSPRHQLNRGQPYPNMMGFVFKLFLLIEFSSVIGLTKPISVGLQISFRVLVIEALLLLI